MSKTKTRAYSRYSQKATAILGELIGFHRKERKLTAQDLADRAGISRTTLQKIEKGDMKCEIGIVFEVAILVGIKLFDRDISSLEALEENILDKTALLPKRIRTPKESVDDNF